MSDWRKEFRQRINKEIQPATQKPAPDILGKLNTAYRELKEMLDIVCEELKTSCKSEPVVEFEEEWINTLRINGHSISLILNETDKLIKATSEFGEFSFSYHAQFNFFCRKNVRSNQMHKKFYYREFFEEFIMTYVNHLRQKNLLKI